MQQQIQQGPHVMLFVFMGLLLGSILRQIYKKTKFPYTPMLLISGLLLGYFRHNLGTVGQSTSIIQQLNPEMILFIFIPVLIFQSGFNCDWFVFRKAIINIIILAAPGVLWGAILLGSCFKVILGYTDQQLSWYQAFTLGSVLSATDPVAVVALLKQLGANIRFNTLIEGQSLLNNGTAMVFFILFLQLAKGNSSSIGQVIANFIQIGIGGPFLGVIIGFFSSYWLKRIINDDILTVNITFISCYLCFYIAQYTWLKVSSILSIVVLGLYMSAVGKTKIYPQSQHSLQIIWSYVQYACQTLIFLLTGVIIGVQMIEKSTITINDWLKMIVFWFLMQIMRLIMVFTFFPFLRYFGYGLSKKQFVVLIYGGLRGALGLCLSLMIGVDKQLPYRFRQLTVFYMSGMATLTILINGLTCAKLVNYIEMIYNPPIKQKLFKSCLKKIEQMAKIKLRELKSNKFLMTAEWKNVQKYIKINRQQNQSQLSLLKQQGYTFNRIHKLQILGQIRFKVVRYLKKLFWQKYQRGQCSQEAVKVLTYSCDVSLDQISEKFTLWEIVSRNFNNFLTLKLWMALKDYPLIGILAKKTILKKVYLVYDTSVCLVTACQEVKQKFESYFPIKKEYLKIVLEEVEQNMELGESYISDLQQMYYNLVLAIHTKKACFNVLTEKKNQLNKMLTEGYIDDRQYKSVRKQLDREFISLQFINFKEQSITFNQILLESPMFHQLQRREITQLRKSAAIVSFEFGKTILLKDKQITNAYIIIKGIVRQSYINNFKVTRGIGNLLNPYSIISGENSLCVLRAASDCELLSINISMFRDIIKKNEKFETKIYKASLYVAIKLKTNNSIISQLSERQIRIKAQKSKLVKLKQNQIIKIENGGYCFIGRLKHSKNIDSKQIQKYIIYESGSILRQNILVKAQKQTTLLLFNQILKLKNQNEPTLISDSN